MLLIQIGISLNEYFAFKTVATLHTETLENIILPNIVICHEKSYNIQVEELVHGIRVDKKTLKGFKAVGWGEELGMKPLDYLSSVAYLKNVDNVSSVLTIDGSENGEITRKLEFKAGRFNLAKGLCFFSEIKADDVKYFFNKINRIQLHIFINCPSHGLNIFLMDQNQFTGIDFNENLFKGDKILENVGGNNLLLYDIEFVATELESRDPGSKCENYGIGYTFFFL